MSSLGTLIKDVRDVAAAGLCSEGPGGKKKSKKVESFDHPGHLKLSHLMCLQGKSCEALFGNLRVLKGLIT